MATFPQIQQQQRFRLPNMAFGAFEYNLLQDQLDAQMNPNNAMGAMGVTNPKNFHTGQGGLWGGQTPQQQPSPPPPVNNNTGGTTQKQQGAGGRANVQQTTKNAGYAGPTTETTEGWAEAGEGGRNLGNAMRNTLLGDAANTGGQILGTIIGKQFQDWSGGSSSSLNNQAIEQGQKMGELNNQLKKAGTFATNAMGYKGAGAQISAKNAMAGFQPDAEDVMARNQANRQADKMTSTMQGQMAATNAAQDRQAGRAVDSTLKTAKQMGGPASLGAAAASGIGQTLAESALNKNAQNAQAIQGANTAAAGMRTSAAQAFNQAKDSAFNRKVQPYMNQWHEPGSESAINTGAGSSESSNRQAGDYPIYDVLGATATALGTRGGYQGSVDMHGTDYKAGTTTTVADPNRVPEPPAEPQFGAGAQAPQQPSAATGQRAQGVQPVGTPLQRQMLPNNRLPNMVLGSQGYNAVMDYADAQMNPNNPRGAAGMTNPNLMHTGQGGVWGPNNIQNQLNTNQPLTPEQIAMMKGRQGGSRAGAGVRR